MIYSLHRGHHQLFRILPQDFPTEDTGPSMPAPRAERHRSRRWAAIGKWRGKSAYGPEYPGDHELGRLGWRARRTQLSTLNMQLKPAPNALTTDR